MGVALITTTRHCLNERCQHGASAHRWRNYKYRPYKAECELCDCERYQDPMITEAEIARGEVERRVRNRAEDVPPKMHLPRLLMTAEEKRDYWREKQRESRARRRLEMIMNGLSTGD